MSFNPIVVRVSATPAVGGQSIDVHGVADEPVHLATLPTVSQAELDGIAVHLRGLLAASVARLAERCHDPVAARFADQFAGFART